MLEFLCSFCLTRVNSSVIKSFIVVIAAECQKKESSSASDDDSSEKAELNAQQAFVFGQNLRDRVKLGDESNETGDVQNAGPPASDAPSATNYFLQYISSR
ncbi:hypothetical protein AV530_017791 [Patagioenas fasciata monilis]|uniref:Uncharacterized protein n=1 Tax=Patagioenas fasciata monilis TaxID=372326 RepID=A0A1V4KT60_PATFA|nr:hypothetical protein AV530_017791 [Patagioenas fasciata monilis]